MVPRYFLESRVCRLSLRRLGMREGDPVVVRRSRAMEKQDTLASPMLQRICRFVRCADPRPPGHSASAFSSPSSFFISSSSFFSSSSLGGTMRGYPRLTLPHRTLMWTASRNYGAAPSRVRPVEVPRENAWRQSEREISASLLIVFMFVVPLWMIIMSNGEKSRKQEAMLEHFNVMGTTDRPSEEPQQAHPPPPS